MLDTQKISSRRTWNTTGNGHNKIMEFTNNHICRAQSAQTRQHKTIGNGRNKMVEYPR